MKISKILVAGLASTCLTVSAMAEVTQPAMTTPNTGAVIFNNHLDTSDLSYAFGGNQDLQVQAMTVQEMNETQGAWVANAIGGLAGMYGGGYGYLAGGGTDPYKFMGAAALGGALGVANPVNGIRSGVTTFGTAFVGTYVPTRFSGKYW